MIRFSILKNVMLDWSLNKRGSKLLLTWTFFYKWITCTLFGAICSIYIMIAERYATFDNFASCQKLIHVLGAHFAWSCRYSSGFLESFIFHSIIMMKLWMWVNGSIAKIISVISISWSICYVLRHRKSKFFLNIVFFRFHNCWVLSFLLRWYDLRIWKP